ncbi:MULTISPECIES: bleomycin resistance protein [Streptomyces]|uniref:VOC family protein n=1 Tax=Streptomyces caniscabiei TaxID=2746961 RepID=A0ABU4MYV8_9ACTN|nr:MULTISPECIES: VOC family protein [Streptomyces]MBE4737715.1 VOC family protein [Streptomyces caniscabiei]MBE4757486.1 VOC family protein [Streptomyces caniscabiei]MBE4769485.1 VOC family protein [Streptomyces caniscabiei]MBE4784794.1 VOC family protein [Streptomyces caniscabiei]MBE4795578.1 VOC family protein [Streptomyces caniscabiei]
MGEKTIPILPCQSLQPLLDFYTALGFEVTFEQRSPNPYAVVERGGVELQFFGLRTYEPTASVSTCYVVTDDVDGLYAAFRAGLKRAYGRVPTRGLPRLGPLKDMSYGMRQFLMTDPGGNCVRVGQPTSEDQHHRPAPRETYARALHHASLLADSRDDPAAAAKVIDRVLRPAEGAPTPTASQLVRLLVLRADVAARTGDEETAADAIRRAGAVPLTDEERQEASDSLLRLEDLRGRERA